MHGVYTQRRRKIVAKQTEAIHSQCRVAHFLLARLSGPQCGTTGPHLLVE